MNNQKTLETWDEWARKELEPYFQGRFGTMDSMLDLFLDKSMDRINAEKELSRQEGLREATLRELDDELNRREQKGNDE